MSYALIARVAAVAVGAGTAVAASPVAAAIGGGVAALGVVSLLTGTARPSTILRITEDAVVAVPRGVARRTASAVHSAKIEYSARQIASARTKLAKQLVTLQTADPDTLAALQRDQDLIAQRVAELTGAGVAPAPKPRKRAAAKNSAPRAKR